MKQAVVLMFACLALVACLPETDVPTIEEAGGDVSSTTDGSSSIGLAVSKIAYNLDTPGPVYATLTIRVERGTTVEVLVDNVEVEEFDVDCLQLPAILDCDSVISENISIIIESAGTHEFEVYAQKVSQSTWRSESFTQNIEQASCQSNETVYEDQMQPFLRNSCESCHGNGNAGLFEADYSWSQIESVLQSKGDLFYKAPSGEVAAHEATPFS